MSALLTWIDEKNESIKKQIKIFFESPEAIERLQSIYVYPIFCNMLNSDNDYGTMGDRQFTDPAEIYHCFNLFQSIIGSINLKVVFVPSIETFCMFMGWTANVYKTQLTQGSIDVQGVMHMIDDYLIESQLSAGQSGFAKANITKFRSQIAGDHGQNLVTQKEENDASKGKKERKTFEELQKSLENMGFMVENKK